MQWMANEAAGKEMGAATNSFKMPDGREFMRCKRMEVLGVAVDAVGSCTTARQWRMAEALRLWWTVRASLVDQRTPVHLRIKKFYETVGQCCLHGCGGWGPTRGAAQDMVSRELMHMREIVGVKKDLQSHGVCGCEGVLRWHTRLAEKLAARHGPGGG